MPAAPRGGGRRGHRLTWRCGGGARGGPVARRAHHLSCTHREACAGLEEHGTALRLQRGGRRAVGRPRTAPLRGYGHICHDEFLGILLCAVLRVSSFDARGRERLGLLGLLLPRLVQVAPRQRCVEATFLVELAQVRKVAQARSLPKLYG